MTFRLQKIHRVLWSDWKIDWKAEAAWL